MENIAILVPYMLMMANIGTLVGILGYAAFCAASKTVTPADARVAQCG